MTVLAIDQGTSGTKAIVVDAVEGVVGLAEVAVHPRYLDGGGVEQDPDELLESVLSAGRGRWPRRTARSTRSRWPIRARRCWRGIPTPAVP